MNRENLLPSPFPAAQPVRQPGCGVSVASTESSSSLGTSSTSVLAGRFSPPAGARPPAPQKHTKTRSPAAQGFLQQIRPFNTGQTVRLPARMVSARRQIFQTDILLTLYNAEQTYLDEPLFPWRTLA